MFKHFIIQIQLIILFIAIYCCVNCFSDCVKNAKYFIEERQDIQVWRSKGTYTEKRRWFHLTFQIGFQFLELSQEWCHDMG